MKTIYLFNTNIVPSASVVKVEEISAETAKELLENQDFVSAIGHAATAKTFSTILGKEVAVNRINANPTAGDFAISLKLNGRLEEGKILSQSEIEAMGYTLFLMSFYNVNSTIVIA